MKATCPNNPKHKRFSTTAHVMQEWVVDQSGAFEKVKHDCLEVTHHPDPDNVWTCATCGAIAEVES